MGISAEILERRSLLSIAESLQLMIGFGSLLISLISLIVVLIKLNNDKKNNRLLTLAS
ncbi:putative holin-like toxin [Carnobacterium viridans]|uniref:Putative Holin-like Toxin (Hol-Tox) n=1 Tax=Carnobacterium viridans TaxID=174587 RepID=A0A1H1B3W9_9LACT|nr:putative holin-like toxin [Carnobacterium viridans]UDE95940.1 putative holin-like toxin [Carnobacterium viridans]SDQ46603.1 Putative Holin-like Toxin (Hol-Tox) [Carnobacterium viridans]